MIATIFITYVWHYVAARLLYDLLAVVAVALAVSLLRGRGRRGR